MWFIGVVRWMRLGVAHHASLKVVITKKEEGKITISGNPLE